MASEIPIWLNEKGVVNEVVFCNMFVEQMPLKYIKGRFYGLDGLISDDIISHAICIMLTEYKFTISERTKKNVSDAVADSCNIIEFLQDDQLVVMGADQQTSCTELYAGYCFWCHRNGMSELKRDSFISWLKNNEERYNIKYDFHITNRDGGRVRGFKGIRTKYIAYVE